MFFEKIKIRLFTYLIFFIYRIFIASWRLKIISHPQLDEDLKNKRPVIFAHWHGDIQAIVAFSRFYQVVSIASVSKDGEIITQVLEKLGLRMARGSSSKKGAQGLRSLLRIAKSGFIPVVAVDGPRGPRHEPKPGVFELSKILGARVYPGGIACSSQYILNKAWDKASMPKLFSRIVLKWGNPIEALGENDDPRDPKFVKELKENSLQAGHLASDALKALH